VEIDQAHFALRDVLVPRPALVKEALQIAAHGNLVMKARGIQDALVRYAGSVHFCSLVRMARRSLRVGKTTQFSRMRGNIIQGSSTPGDQWR
jgi:hypothetical protein